ncbi:MAG: NAD+ synthase [Thermotogaceae bacterium]|nr:NAD+ synthase [Thermotogaceae bacterium]
MRFGLAQINPTVGDIKGNVEKIKKAIDELKKKSPDIIVFPEMVLTGYPLKDLLLRKDFLSSVKEASEQIEEYAKERKVAVVLGLPVLGDGNLRNMAYIFYEGYFKGYSKRTLSQDFDEDRYFVEGNKALLLVEGNEEKLGITIGSEIFNEDVIKNYANFGVSGIINISAFPFVADEYELKRAYIACLAKKYNIWIISINLVGGQDEFVFQGASFVVNPYGEIVHELESFEEELSVVDIDTSANPVLRPSIDREEVHVEVIVINTKRKKKKYHPQRKVNEDRETLILKALKLALKDYVKKNDFEKVVVGLSGGIDSSVVASIAALALGKDNVVGVLMPSMYTSKESNEDALLLAKNLGIKTYTVPITDVFENYKKALKNVFGKSREDVTEENIQARIRGNYLMAISNKFGHLVVTTGNKSEAATGYATLYGDMAGGFALLIDLYKTDVYNIARKINEVFGKEVIPERVFVKPPSAELKPGQKDQDKLPPYEELDKILKLFIEKHCPPEKIEEEGFDKKIVEYVIRLVKTSEYKRVQSAIGPKISSRSFSADWHMPVTNKFIV